MYSRTTTGVKRDSRSACGDAPWVAGPRRDPSGRPGVDAAGSRELPARRGLESAESAARSMRVLRACGAPFGAMAPSSCTTSSSTQRLIFQEG